MLLRNCGIRDIAYILEVSAKTVLRCGENLALSPSKNEYDSVQIDEFWTYVKRRKEGKKWVLYAYASETKEVLAYVIGTRSRKTVRKLMKLLKKLNIKEFCTDNWRAFQEAIPENKHKIGKAFTTHIEGANTFLRARCRRFVRQTTCFSKSEEYLKAALNMIFFYRNHHTI